MERSIDLFHTVFKKTRWEVQKSVSFIVGNNSWSMKTRLFVTYSLLFFVYVINIFAWTSLNNFLIALPLSDFKTASLGFSPYCKLLKNTNSSRKNASKNHILTFSKFSGVINQVGHDKGSVQASKEVNTTCEGWIQDIKC